MVTVVFTPETQLTLFVSMRIKESAETLGKRMPIAELSPYHRKSRLQEQMDWLDF